MRNFEKQPCKDEKIEKKLIILAKLSMSPNKQTFWQISKVALKTVSSKIFEYYQHGSE